MAKQERPENATPGSEAVGMGADQGDSTPPPSPSNLAAGTAGAVGPGAVATVSSEHDRGREADGLSANDLEVVRDLVRRAGGVDALVRWLKQHPDIH